MIIKIDISNDFNTTCRALTSDVLIGRSSRDYACGLKRGYTIFTCENLSNLFGYFKTMHTCHGKLRYFDWDGQVHLTKGQTGGQQGDPLEMQIFNLKSSQVKYLHFLTHLSGDVLLSIRSLRDYIFHTRGRTSSDPETHPTHIIKMIYILLCYVMMQTHPFLLTTLHTLLANPCQCSFPVVGYVSFSYVRYFNFASKQGSSVFAQKFVSPRTISDGTERLSKG